MEGIVIDPNAINDDEQMPAIPSTDAKKVVRIDEEGRPLYTPTLQKEQSAFKAEQRRVAIPPHRISPLKSNWKKVYGPLVEHLLLQVRFNTKRKSVDMRSTKESIPNALQKGVDYITAFCLGFDLDDAVALLRLDDIFIETFEIKDVKASLNGDHLSRAIGRIAGYQGRTKYAIENTTRTRVVLADTKIHLLGGYENIAIARRAICNLILGRSPGKVYDNLRHQNARMKERF